ncbi:GumC family protein [Marinicellulosiphila megalodicopiae]|uniref:GumC family protein n=1 Tax=Marinicellulosiphila megalodicopiae TaxID=2724896 RepID=UPI003BB22507
MLSSEHNKDSQSQEQVIDLKKTFLTVYKVKWRILIVSFLVTIIAAYAAMNMTPEYRSTATLLIESQQTKAIQIDEVYGLNSNNSEYLLTQFEILKSRNIAERVFNELNIADTLEQSDKVSLKQKVKNLIPFLPQETIEQTSESIEAQHQIQVSNFAANISISPVRKTQLVKVSFNSQDPELARDVANAVGNAYIKSQLEAKLGITSKASTWVGGQLIELEQTLTESEKKLDAFRKKHDLIDIEGIATLESKELQKLKDEIALSSAIKIKADSLLKIVEQYGSDNFDLLESLPAISNHPAFQNAKKEVLIAEKEFSELSQIYGPKHPTYIIAKAQLESVRLNFTSQIVKQIEGIEKEAQAAKINLTVLQEEFDKAKANFSKINNLTSQYRQIEREVETNRQLYGNFLSRQKEMDITFDFDSQVARFTDYAIRSNYPVKPNKKLLVLMAFVGSLGFCVMLALLLDALNDTIKSRDDVENNLALRMLGFIPKIPKKLTDTQLANLFFNEAEKLYAEAIRSIRTSISLLAIDKPIKILEVTSSVPSEGKSSTSMNLAYSFASMEKVLIVDCDLRKPKIAKRFDLPAYQNGLSNYLAGSDALEDCICTNLKGNVDVLPAGSIPLNPLELLSSEKFKTLLETLKTTYDKIILDTPPIHAVSDALVLAPMCDATILVVKADATNTNAIKRTSAQITQSHGKLLGVVLNQFNTKNASEDYGYYQYSEYKDKKS